LGYAVYFSYRSPIVEQKNTSAIDQKLHNGFGMAQFQMQPSRSQGPYSVSDLLRQVHEFDTSIQECVSELIKSAECRVIDDLVTFFRAETHKITWETISILFQLP
jgi:hypothetical protein